jgi:fucose permease
MNKENSINKLLPVMFGFFIMGFVDIIGMANNYMKNDFTDLTDSTVNLISLSCFLWFLLISIPTGMLMNKIGRKNTVLISFACHIFAMCIPVFFYSFYSMLAAFSLLGIGNTTLQVSLNPLIMDVVTNKKLTGTLTFGQFVKAMSSFFGPLVTGYAAGLTFGWKMIFPVYAGLSLLALIWLWFTPIKESSVKNKNVSLHDTVILLKDKQIACFFIGILVLVGVDVSMNITLPKYLIERCGLNLVNASMSNSIYFFARTIGAFIGGIMLMRFSEIKFYTYSALTALIGLLLMVFGNSQIEILACAVIFGLGYANIFSIIFSCSLKKMPEKANEISALLIVGICGGAILPPIIGIITDNTQAQVTAIIFLALIWIYMIWLIKSMKYSHKMK